MKPFRRVIDYVRDRNGRLNVYVMGPLETATTLDNFPQGVIYAMEGRRWPQTPFELEASEAALKLGEWLARAAASEMECHHAVAVMERLMPNDPLTAEARAAFPHRTLEQVADREGYDIEMGVVSLVRDHVILERAVRFSRGADGVLSIQLDPDWDGVSRLVYFPDHIQRTVQGRPLMLSPEYTERVRVAKAMGPDVYAAVWDDTQCVRAARLIAEATLSTDPFRQEALRVYGEGHEDPQPIKNLAEALVLQAARVRGSSLPEVMLLPEVDEEMEM